MQHCLISIFVRAQLVVVTRKTHRLTILPKKGMDPDILFDTLNRIPHPHLQTKTE